LVSAKGPKTISALAWTVESPAMLANFDGCGTRFAQTVLAVSPKLTALLGNAKGNQTILNFLFKAVQL